MRSSALLLAALLLAAAPLGCSEEAETKVVEATAAEHGEALFHDPGLSGVAANAYSCGTCHEATPGERPGVILPGLPLAGAVNRPSFWGGEEIELLRSVNYCFYYFMLADHLLTPEDPDARALYAYLESLPSSPELDAAQTMTPVILIADPPPGDAARGAASYAAACGLCHGESHTAAGRLVSFAPLLPEQTLEEHPLTDYTALERRLVFVDKVRHGGFVGYGGSMPPFSAEKLSDQDLGDILTFLGL